jgi:hypothetical protein
VGGSGQTTPVRFVKSFRHQRKNQIGAGRVVGGSGQTTPVRFVRSFRRGCTFLVHSSASVALEVRPRSLSVKDAASSSGPILLVGFLGGGD